MGKLLNLQMNHFYCSVPQWHKQILDGDKVRRLDGNERREGSSTAVDSELATAPRWRGMAP